MRVAGGKSAIGQNSSSAEGGVQHQRRDLGIRRQGKGLRKNKPHKKNQQIKETQPPPNPPNQNKRKQPNQMNEGRKQGVTDTTICAGSTRTRVFSVLLPICHEAPVARNRRAPTRGETKGGGEKADRGVVRRQRRRWLERKSTYAPF